MYTVFILVIIWGGVSFFNNSNKNWPIETKLGTHGYFADPRYDSGFRKNSRALTWVTMVTGFLPSVVNKNKELGAVSPKLIELWHWNLVKCLIFKKACRKVLFHRLWAFSPPVGAIFDHFWLKRPIFRVSMATSQAHKSNFLFKIAQACWTSHVASYRSSLGQKRTKIRDLEPFSCCHDAFWQMPVAMVTRNSVCFRGIVRSGTALVPSYYPWRHN